MASSLCSLIKWLPRSLRPLFFSHFWRRHRRLSPLQLPRIRSIQAPSFLLCVRALSLLSPSQTSPRLSLHPISNPRSLGVWSKCRRTIHRGEDDATHDSSSLPRHSTFEVFAHGADASSLSPWMIWFFLLPSIYLSTHSLFLSLFDSVSRWFFLFNFVQFIYEGGMKCWAKE